VNSFHRTVTGLPGDTTNSDNGSGGDYNPFGDFNPTPVFTYPTNATLKWYLAMSSTPFGASLSLAPDGTLYVPVCSTVIGGGNDGNALWAINPSTVNTNDVNYPSAIDFENWIAVLSGFGAEVTPTIGIDGKVYTSSAYDTLSAFNSTNGNIIWNLKIPLTGNFYPLQSSPAISKNGTFYISNTYFVVAVTNAPGLTNVFYTTNIFYGSIYINSYALTNVGVKWVYAYPNVSAYGSVETNFVQTGSGGNVQGFLNSSPAIGLDETVFVNTDLGQLIALNPTNGTLKWVTSKSSAALYSSPPIISQDGTVYWGSKNYFFAIDPNSPVTNEVIGYKWIYQAPSQNQFLFSPVIGFGGVVYVEDTGTTNQLLAFDPMTGNPEWTNNLGSVSFSPGSWKRGSLAVAADGEIYLADMDGALYSFSPSGVTNWIFQTSQFVHDTSHLGSPLIGPDGTIYVSSYNNDNYTCYVYAFAGASPIACSSWPEMGKNARRTAAVALAQVSSPLMTTNGFQLTITGITNMPVCTFSSSDLKTWTNIGQTILTGGSTNFVDIGATNYPYRFYRAIPQ